MFFMPAFDVITIGAATQDVFLRSRRFEEVKNLYAPDGLDACLPLGAKVELDDIVFTTGGGATNAAVTFARFGLKTACVTRVGKDAAGQVVRQELEHEHVSTVGLQEDVKYKTAYSVIIISGSGHRAIVTYRGASKHLDQKRIPWNALATSWIYVTSVGGNMELLRRIFVFAENIKASIAWNPGVLELEHGLKKLEPFLARTSVLLLNREEAASLIEMPPRHLTQILAHLSVYPRSGLVVTDGQHGAYVRAEGKTFSAPALRAKRVNTTGAGDGFGSAFVASLIKKRPIKAALQTAMLNATGVVTHMGAKAGILKKMPGSVSLLKVKVKEKK